VNGSPPLPAWDARELSHVRDAMIQAPMRTDPAQHLYVENIFSPEMYAAMMRLFPDPAVLEPWAAEGAFGNYQRRTEINLPRQAQRLPPDQRAFWMDAAALFGAPEFFRTLVERFDPYARERFGDALDDPSFLRERLLGSLILNQHDADYYLGPHTDRGERVFTALFYFPEHDGLEHLGTTIYRPLEDGFTCTGAIHHDPAGFERRETMPYRANSVLIFPRTDALFHGVHRLTAEELLGSRRRGMQVQFMLNNARPRESCKTALHLRLPAAMPAHDLTSDFPFETQLGYRWIGEDGREVEPERSVRSRLPRAVPAGTTVEGSMRIVAPHAPGRFVMRAAVVQEGVAWFDDLDPQNGTVAEVVVYDPPAAASADIVPAAGDVALGGGWHAPEKHASAPCRLADDGAVVHVAALRPVRSTLVITAEPGLGEGAAPLEVTARLADGREIGGATMTGRQTLAFPLPPESPAVFTVVLNASARLRVWSVSVDRAADVFPAWALPASGFYPLERQDGEVFRWVCGDAVVELDRACGESLEFDAESGPGMRSLPFRLRIAGPDGADLAEAEIGSRTRVRVPLRAAGGAGALLFRAEGGGVSIAGDPRTLNFRVFAPRS
jgi:hypothetical protein